MFYRTPYKASMFIENLRRFSMFIEDLKNSSLFYRRGLVCVIEGLTIYFLCLIKEIIGVFYVL